MEKSTANPVIYIAEIDRKYSLFLGRIRHWEKLAIAFDENLVLVKGFNRAETLSADLMGIPFIKLYKLSDNLLFPIKSELPEKKINSTLLWTPIARALPVTLPKPNHFFFGVNQKVDFKLVKSDRIFEPVALLIDKDVLINVISSLPKARFYDLSWIILENKALILGTPLLPLEGLAFYKVDNFIFPCGYAPEFPLMNKINGELINPDGNCLIFFHNQYNYSLLSKQDFRPLSRSSVRLSLTH